MTPGLGSRKRADEFDQLLSCSSDTPATTAVTPYGDLLRVVDILHSTPAPALRAGFSADLRARLMEAAAVALAPDTPAQSAARRATALRHTPRERRIVAAVGGFAIVSATASMALAAQSALPGDSLYPLKRAMENAEAGVQRDADGKGTALLDNASGRLDEVNALSRSGDDAQVITTTLEDFVTQASEASDLLLSDYASTGHASSIEELRAFTADSMGTLTRLQDLIPDDARDSLIEAAQVINAIDVQAQGLCPACTDLPIIEAPVFARQGGATSTEGAFDPAATSDVSHLDASASAAEPGPRAKTRGADKASGQSRNGKQDASPASATDEAVIPDDPTGPSTSPSTGPAPSSDDGDGDDSTSSSGGILDGLQVSGSEDPIGDRRNGDSAMIDKAVKHLGALGKN